MSIELIREQQKQEYPNSCLEIKNGNNIVLMSTEVIYTGESKNTILELEIQIDGMDKSNRWYASENNLSVTWIGTLLQGLPKRT